MPRYRLKTIIEGNLYVVDALLLIGDDRFGVTLDDVSGRPRSKRIELLRRLILTRYVAAVKRPPQVSAPVSPEAVDQENLNSLSSHSSVRRSAKPCAELAMGAPNSSASQPRRHSKRKRSFVKPYNPEAEASRPQLAPTKACTAIKRDRVVATDGAAAGSSPEAAGDVAGDGGNWCSQTGLSKAEERAALRLLSSELLKLPAAP